MLPCCVTAHRWRRDPPRRLHPLYRQRRPPLLIDAQGSAIDDAVWSLYRQVVERIGPAATLIEWDNDVPGFSTLHGQACIAPDVMSAETQKLAAGA